MSLLFPSKYRHLHHDSSVIALHLVHRCSFPLVEKENGLCMNVGERFSRELQDFHEKSRAN